MKYFTSTASVCCLAALLALSSGSTANAFIVGRAEARAVPTNVPLVAVRSASFAGTADQTSIPFSQPTGGQCPFGQTQLNDMCCAGNIRGGDCYASSSSGGGSIQGSSSNGDTYGSDSSGDSDDNDDNSDDNDDNSDDSGDDDDDDSSSMSNSGSSNSTNTNNNNDNSSSNNNTTNVDSNSNTSSTSNNDNSAVKMQGSNLVLGLLPVALYAIL